MARKCRICGKSFPTDIALKSHLKENHRGYYYGVRLAPLIAIIILLAAILALSLPGGITVTTSQTSVSSTALPTASTQIAQAQSSQRSPAPDFELPEIDRLGLTGRMIRLSQFEGKPVFLEFMSPACIHCLRMAPIIKELEKEYGDRIVFISVVYPAGGVDYASKVLAEEGLDWIHVVDERLTVFNAYNIAGTPTYVILDKNHVEVKRIVGEKSKSALEEAILSVLS